MGDESLLLVTNRSEDSVSVLGTNTGERYLQQVAAGYNFSIKDTFLKHCLDSKLLLIQHQLSNNFDC